MIRFIVWCKLVHPSLNITWYWCPLDIYRVCCSQYCFETNLLHHILSKAIIQRNINLSTCRHGQFKFAKMLPAVLCSLRYWINPFVSSPLWRFGERKRAKYWVSHQLECCMRYCTKLNFFKTSLDCRFYVLSCIPAALSVVKYVGYCNYCRHGSCTGTTYKVLTYHRSCLHYWPSLYTNIDSLPNYLLLTHLVYMYYYFTVPLGA